MSGLRVEDVVVRYGDRTVLDRASVAVAPGEIVGLLGPSGSGKSTLLQVIAGVLRPDCGRILWDGADITGLPTHRRGFGMVFQDPLLFPHLDVAGNVGYGPRVAGMGRADLSSRVGELLAMVDLAGFERRRVDTLSGGEAQRVALARALAPQPSLMLLDEPFGALDRDLRLRLAVEVRDLLHGLGTPAIHVTHDAEEASLIADRVVRLTELQAPA